MKREDFVIGGRYRVNRQGLVNHGRIGICKRIGVRHVDLEIVQTGDTHTFNMRSLAPVEIKPAPKKPAPKPNAERKPLKKEGEEVKPKVVEIEVPAKPEGNEIFFWQDGNKVRYGYPNDYDFLDDEVRAKWGENVIPKAQYLGYLPRGAHLFAIRPKNPMQYPFWDDTWGKTKELGQDDSVWTVGGTHGEMYMYDANRVVQNRIMINLEWIDFKKSFVKTVKAKREVFPEGFQPNHLQKAIQDAKGRAQRATGLAFDLWYEYGGKVYHRQRDMAACHYAMQTVVDGNHREKAKAVLAKQYITSKHYRHFEDGQKPMVDKWLEWVANDSPWAQYIETKDLDQARDEGFTVRTNIPANAMMCTFYALRYPTEYPDKIRDWAKAIEMGAHPTVAFYYAETFGFKHDHASHHGLLDTHSMTLDHVKAFVKHEEGQVKDKVYDDKYWRYSNVSIHHGQIDRPDLTGLDELKRMFKGGFEEVDHPVLGKQRKEIPADQQIINYLMVEREK